MNADEKKVMEALRNALIHVSPDLDWESDDEYEAWVKERRAALDLHNSIIGNWFFSLRTREPKSKGLGFLLVLSASRQDQS